jgi:hypothetical protein
MAAALSATAFVMVGAGCAESPPPAHDNVVSEGSQRADSAWGTDPAAAPDRSPSPAASTAALRGSAERFVRNFYADIEARHYGQAWNRLSSDARASMGSFEAWRAGYATTTQSQPTQLSATTMRPDAAVVSLTLRAADLDVCAATVRRQFAVTWSLRRRGDRWIGTNVHGAKTAGHDPVTDATACASADDAPDERIMPPDSGGTDGGPGYVDPCIDSCDGPGPQGNGSYTHCTDGSLSHSGRIQGACSHHGGLADNAPSTDDTPSTDSSGSSGGTVHVRGYYRKDGTYVQPYTRRSP